MKGKREMERKRKGGGEEEREIESKKDAKYNLH